MTAGIVSRLARTLSIVFLFGAVIAGLAACIQIAYAQHGASAAAMHQSTRAISTPHRATPHHATPHHARVTELRNTHRRTVTTAPSERTYTVRSGDTLSSIATRFYGTADGWPVLYHANRARIVNPDVIYPGEVLTVPAKPAHLTALVTDASASEPATSRASTTAAVRTTYASGTPSRDGPYACAGLETLWDQAGGNPADARIAAEIAMAESGGDASAISPTDDYGLWQINASNGALATLSPAANARSAVIISRDGTDWYPWTTYRTGDFWGRC